MNENKWDEIFYLLDRHNLNLTILSCGHLVLVKDIACFEDPGSLLHYMLEELEED